MPKKKKYVWVVKFYDGVHIFTTERKALAYATTLHVDFLDTEKIIIKKVQVK